MASVGNSFCISFTALVSGLGLVNATSSQQAYYLVIMGGGGAADPSCPANQTLLSEAQDAITGASYTIQNTTIRFQCGRNGFDCQVVLLQCCQTADGCNVIQKATEAPTPTNPGLTPSTSIAVGVTVGTVLLAAIAGSIYCGFVLWKRGKRKSKKDETYSATNAAYEESSHQQI